MTIEYVTIAHQNKSRTWEHRWTLTKTARQAADRLRMTQKDYLDMHRDMAERDELWMFHKRRSKVFDLYDLIVFPKNP